ncbi:MAG: hypothetical protein NUW12_01230 [Firmicutes bacterium]|jgi:hypothetical protein|nr:hypothetical protein [Bacillota bacterium]MDH7494569.1 hypothetical protein [Bacillota bacterium]
MDVRTQRNTSGPRAASRFGAIAAAVVLAVAQALLSMAGPALAQERRDGTQVVFGGPIHVAADEVVEGDVVSLGNRVTVDGRVTGDAVSVGSVVEVNGVVEGDAVSIGSSVILGENARVGGDVSSVGGSVRRSPGAVVGGSTTSGAAPFRFNFRGMNWPRLLRPWRMSGAYLAFGWLARLVGALVLALVVVALWPDHTAAVGAAVETRLGRAVLVGLVAWLLFVPGMILLAITIVGIPLIPIWVLFYVAAATLGHAAVAVVVGDRVGRLARANMTILVRVIIGVLVLAALGLVPGINAVVFVLVAVIGLGAVLDTRFGTNRPWFGPRQAQQHGSSPSPQSGGPMPPVGGAPAPTQPAQPAEYVAPPHPAEERTEPSDPRQGS